jgi:hypothetical protein
MSPQAGLLSSVREGDAGAFAGVEAESESGFRIPQGHWKRDAGTDAEVHTAREAACEGDFVFTDVACVRIQDEEAMGTVLALAQHQFGRVTRATCGFPGDGAVQGRCEKLL